MLRWLVVLAMLFGASVPARADDISAAARGVVRVVVIATVDGEVVDVEHGSGFAVAPGRIVTNAHVVQLMQRYPGDVVIGIVPSEGDRSIEGRLVATDPERDLALIAIQGLRLPPLALYGGPVDDAEALTSLGYPANVDLATARSAADFITPTLPVRSSGALSGMRRLGGTAVLVHTASIARGNSGGPLLDRCGRVLGVNSALTRSEEGDASFAFAIANAELAAFLREANVTVPSVTTPCITMAESDARDRAEAERLADDAQEQARIEAERATLARVDAIEDARAAHAKSRENQLALAALLLALGVLALGGAGLLASRRDPRWRWIAATGTILFAAAVLVFLLRRDFDPDAVPATTDTGSAVRSARLSGPLVCTLIPERSRAILSPEREVAFDWRDDGCMNGRTQYAEATGGAWERILVPAEEATVSVLRFEPATGAYTNLRYLLNAEQMERARELRGRVDQKTCVGESAGRAALGTQQAAIRSALPANPNERLVYRCERRRDR